MPRKRPPSEFSTDALTAARDKRGGEWTLLERIQMDRTFVSAAASWLCPDCREHRRWHTLPYRRIRSRGLGSCGSPLQCPRQGLSLGKAVGCFNPQPPIMQPLDNLLQPLQAWTIMAIDPRSDALVFVAKHRRYIALLYASLAQTVANGVPEAVEVHALTDNTKLFPPPTEHVANG